jgi:hypothetical protein
MKFAWWCGCGEVLWLLSYGEEVEGRTSWFLGRNVVLRAWKIAYELTRFRVLVILFPYLSTAYEQIRALQTGVTEQTVLVNGWIFFSLCSLLHFIPNAVVHTPASYSGGPRFKSRPGERLSLVIFRGFPQSFQVNAGIVPQNYAKTASFQIFQFTIYVSPFHSKLYSLSYWESVVK